MLTECGDSPVRIGAKIDKVAALADDPSATLVGVLRPMVGWQETGIDTIINDHRGVEIDKILF